MERFNRFLCGFVPGLMLPILFLWAYIHLLFPIKAPFFEIIKGLFPSVMLGKLLLLSIMPNLVFVFVFYKQDFFKIGIGMMLSALPYLITAMFMM